MDDILKINISFKSFFISLTSTKAIIIFFIIGFIVFGNMLFNGFVWDDNLFIDGFRNPDISGTFNPFASNMFNGLGYYRPLPAFYFFTLYNLFKEVPFFYHLPQLILHIIATFLIFSFIKRFFHISLAFFLSLIFLVHPINVESVSYIGATQSELFLLLGLLALLLIKKAGNFIHFFIIGFVLLLALLTKESAILFFIVIPLWSVLFRKKYIVILFVTQLLALSAYLFIRLVIGGVFFEKFGSVPIAKLPLVLRLFNIPKIILYYLHMSFFPANLSIAQHWTVTNPNIANFYFPLLAELFFFSILIALGFYLYKKKKDLFKVYLFFIIWFIVGLSFVLQIFPLDMTVADRWFYFPLIGLLGVLGSVLKLIYTRHKKVFPVLIYIFIVIIIALSLRTAVRNTNWIDNITFFSHDRKIHTNRFIENDLGLYYSRAGDYSKAKEAFHRAVQYGDWDEAYENSVNLGLATGDPSIDRNYITAGLNKYPRSGRLWLYLAIFDYGSGQIDKAKTEIIKALKYKPEPLAKSVYNKIITNQPLN